MQIRKTIEFKFQNAEESIKEFYFYMGLLSTKFAILEYNVLLILGKLITDDFVLTNTLLEKNTLNQNIELLKKINRYKQFEEGKLSKLTAKISSVRTVRNLFIHGVWGTPVNKENDLIINCSEPKLAYEENNNSRKWTSARNHMFRLSYIKKLVREIEIIILEQEYIFNKIDK